MVSFVSLIVVIIAAFFGSLVTEDYRRFRDGGGLAAALAGELSGYIDAFELMLTNLAVLEKLAREGKKIPFREFEMPKDSVYEALVEKLGLLGTGMAKDTAYVYQRIHGFRVGYMILTRVHASLEGAVIAESLRSCADSLHAARARALPLLKALEVRANDEYTLPRLPRWGRRRRDDWGE